MPPEEVIEETTGGKNKFLKRLIITTTKGYKIQAYWNMNDNTVEYVYAGDFAFGCEVSLFLLQLQVDSCVHFMR